MTKTSAHELGPWKRTKSVFKKLTYNHIMQRISGMSNARVEIPEVKLFTPKKKAPADFRGSLCIEDAVQVDLTKIPMKQ